MHEEKGLHISLAAEKLGYLWGLPITNTLTGAWLVMIVLIVLAIIVRTRLQLIPNKLQNFFELIFEFVLDYMTNILGSRARAKAFFPLIATLFLFIGLSNLFDYMPFVGSVKFYHGDEVHALFRPVNTDLNVTLALAIVAVFAIEISGILALGLWRYGSKFINFSSPLNFVVGLIELVSELSRFISYSFRLYGNIFAGEVLIGVTAFFMPYVLPVPLMAFETFVGIVQATVFAMLTLFFIKLATTPPHGTHEKHAVATQH